MIKINLLKPQNRIEDYLYIILKKLNGEDINLNSLYLPKCRIEDYLYKIALNINSSQGGGTSPPSNVITDIEVRNVEEGDTPSLTFTRENNKYLVDIVFPTSGTNFSGNAIDITYDDTTTKLGATDVQNAIIKLREYVDKKDSENLQNANKYTDQEKINAVNDANSYTDLQIQKLQNTGGVMDYDYVDKSIANLKGGVSTDLDTLKKLADAINNDPLFATNIKNEIIQTLADSKSYTDQEIAKINGLEMVIGQTLPPTGDANKLYLIPSNSGGMLDQYIWDTTTQAFVPIGTTNINLSQYALKTDIPTLISQLTNNAKYTTIDDNNTKQDATWSSQKIQQEIQAIQGSGGATDARGISYSNNGSGLLATNVQTAIDEIKIEVDNAKLGNLNVQVVQTLPTTGVTGAIYMVENTINPVAKDQYDAYIWLNGKWETVGSGINRSEVYLKSETLNKEEIMQLLSAQNTQKIVVRLSSYDDRDLTGVEVTYTNLFSGVKEVKEYDPINHVSFLVPSNERYRIDFEELPDASIYGVEYLAAIGSRYIDAKYEQYFKYGFRINKNEANPDLMVEYIGENELYKPISIDPATGQVDYGDWGNAWFITNNKPCLLRDNGDVETYLDRYNQEYDETGKFRTEVKDSTYPFNMMSEIPLGWLYEYEDRDYIYFYVSNKQIDSNYQALGFQNANGEIQDKVYVSMMPCNSVSGKWRCNGANASPSASTETQKDYTYAEANGKGWHIISYQLYHYLTVLSTMLFKNTNFINNFGGKVYVNSNDAYRRKQANINTGQFYHKYEVYRGAKLFYIDWFIGSHIVMGGLCTNAINQQQGTIWYKNKPPFAFPSEDLLALGYKSITGFPNPNYSQQWVQKLGINQSLDNTAFPISVSGASSKTYMTANFQAPRDYNSTSTSYRNAYKAGGYVDNTAPLYSPWTLVYVSGDSAILIMYVGGE